MKFGANNFEIKQKLISQNEQFGMFGWLLYILKGCTLFSDFKNIFDSSGFPPKCIYQKIWLKLQLELNSDFCFLPSAVFIPVTCSALKIKVKRNVFFMKRGRFMSHGNDQSIPSFMPSSPVLFVYSYRNKNEGQNDIFFFKYIHVCNPISLF